MGQRTGLARIIPIKPMLEILKFIFSDLWIFVGTAILLGIICEAVSSIFKK